LYIIITVHSLAPCFLHLKWFWFTIVDIWGLRLFILVVTNYSILNDFIPPLLFKGPLSACWLILTLQALNNLIQVPLNMKSVSNIDAQDWNGQVTGTTGPQPSQISSVFPLKWTSRVGLKQLLSWIPVLYHPCKHFKLVLVPLLLLLIFKEIKLVNYCLGWDLPKDQ
jgi:hypothetical protein